MSSPAASALRRLLVDVQDVQRSGGPLDAPLRGCPRQFLEYLSDRIQEGLAAAEPVRSGAILPETEAALERAQAKAPEARDTVDHALLDLADELAAVGELTVEIIRREVRAHVENSPDALCLHCGGKYPKTTLDHWKACEKHPARAAVEELSTFIDQIADSAEAGLLDLAPANVTFARTMVAKFRRPA